MKALLLMGVVSLLAAQSLPSVDMPPIVCDGTETPCDPARPWYRGSIEKMCGSPKHLAEMKKKKPNAQIVKCLTCKHRCDPANKYAAQTDNRAWDGRCAARCSPSLCGCAHPCDT